MHPTIMSEIGKARIADWHRQADRDRTARAARQARRAHTHRPGRPALAHPATIRRLLAALGARTSG